MTMAERFIMRCLDDTLEADRPKAQVDSVIRTASRIVFHHMIGLPRMGTPANDL